MNYKHGKYCPPSARCQRIRMFHKREGTDQSWDRARYYRLCRLLNSPVNEVAALFAIPGHRIKGWLQENSIPAWVALHFVGLERAFIEAKCGMKAKPHIPLSEYAN